MVVVNKVDGLAPGELPRLLAALAALNPGARLLPAEFGRVDARELVGARRFDADAAAGRAGWLAELHAAAEARASGGGAERDGGGGAAPARGHAHAHAQAAAGRGAKAAHFGVSAFVYHARRCALPVARCARAGPALRGCAAWGLSDTVGTLRRAGGPRPDAPARPAAAPRPGGACCSPGRVSRALSRPRAGRSTRRGCWRRWSGRGRACCAARASSGWPRATTWPAFGSPPAARGAAIRGAATRRLPSRAAA